MGLGENPHLRGTARQEVEPSLILLDAACVLDIPGADSKVTHWRPLFALVRCPRAVSASSAD